MFVKVTYTLKRSVMHSFIEQIFTRHLCAWCYSRRWGYSSKQDGQG